MRTSRIDSAGRAPRTRTTTLDLFRHDMRKLTVYGLPLNPLSALDQLAGASFCVSYGTRDKLNGQLDDAIRLVGEDQILIVDNGAFGMRRRPRRSLPRRLRTLGADHSRPLPAGDRRDP